MISWPCLPPARELAEGLVEHVQRERLHQPGLLGRRDEVARRDHAALRVLPAHERLDARELARAHVDLRLVVQQQLAVADRARKLGEQRQARGVVMVELGRVDRVRRARVLGEVHRDVGALQQQVDVVSVSRIARDADARLDVQRQPVDEERLLERREDPLDHVLEDARRLADVRDEDAELVAAEPGHRVGLAHDRGQAARKLDQQQIAVVVAEGVVDLLEAIEVHQQDGELGALAICGLDRALDLLAEARTVRQPGQAVVQRQVQVQLGEPAQLDVRLLARGDVAADALHADRVPVLLDHTARDLEHDEVPVLRDELLLEGRAADLARELARGRELGLLETPVGEVAREVRADQLLAVVAEHELERAVDVGDLLVHRDRADRLVRVLEEVAVAILALARGHARARALDRDGGQVRRELDEVGIAVGARAGLAVVQREGSEQRAVGREERRRPAGA